MTFANSLILLLNLHLTVTTTALALYHSDAQENETTGDSLMKFTDTSQSKIKQVERTPENTARIESSFTKSLLSSSSEEQHSIENDKLAPLSSLNNTDLLNNSTSETVPPYMQHMTSVLVILHLSVFISGLVGNALVCLSVYRNKSLQTVTNYYIVNLAVADFLVILICLPPTVYWDLTLTWNFGLILCKLVLYLQSTSVSVSVLTLTCISIDRWYAICRPLEFSSTKSRAKVIIAMIWLSSMLIASPDVMFLTTRPLYEENGFVYMDCTYSWPENNTKMYQLCITTLLFVCPFVLMMISYSHIVNVLWRNESMAELLKQSLKTNEERRKSIQWQPKDEGNSQVLMVADDTIEGSSTDSSQIDKQKQQQLLSERQTSADAIQGNRGNAMVVVDRAMPKVESHELSSIGGEASILRSHLNVINSSISAQSIPSVGKQEKSTRGNLSPAEGDGKRGLNLSAFEAQVKASCVAATLNGAKLPFDSTRLKEEKENEPDEEKAGFHLASNVRLGSKSSERSEAKSHNVNNANVIALTSSRPFLFSSQIPLEDTKNCCKLEQHKQLNPQLAYERITQSERKQSSIQRSIAKSSHPIVIALEKINQSKAQLNQLLEKHQINTLDKVSEDINGLPQRDSILEQKNKPPLDPIGSVSGAPSISATKAFLTQIKTSNSPSVNRIEDKELEKKKKKKKIEGPSKCTNTRRKAIEERTELVISALAERDAAHLTKAIVGSSDSKIELKYHRGCDGSTNDTSDSLDEGVTTSTLLFPVEVEHISCVESTLKLQQKRGSEKNCWNWLLFRSKKRSPSLNEDKFLGMSNKSYKRYQKNLSNYAAKQVKYGVENSLTSCTVNTTRSSLQYKTTCFSNICSTKKRASKESHRKGLEKPHLILERSNGASVAAGDEVTTYSDDVGGTTSVGGGEGHSNSPSRFMLNQHCTNSARFNKLIESRKKAAKMLIVIVIMFGLCYLPVHFLNTLRCTIGLPQNNTITLASLISHWLCYFNSAVNPLIYNLMSDPKSLATLAITTANSKKKNDSPDRGKYDVDHKFRSTDEFVAGWTAAFINTTALFPINKLIFRQMSGGHGAQYAADQMKEEGLRYLYRGILPPLIQKMVSVSIMFGSFGHYKKWADRKFTSSPAVLNLAMAACLTGATEAVLTPLERVQMLLQDRRYHKDYRNTADALIKLRRFGSAECYRGLTCVLLRNGPSNILFFGLRDEIKKLMPRWNSSSQRNNGCSNSHQNCISSGHFHTSSQTTTSFISTGHSRDKDSMLHDFLSGAILGMFISTLFYPLSVVRTRMQTRAPGTEFLSIVKAFNAVYSERDKKFSRLFHGCLINVLRQFVSWGIINCSYEFVLDLLHNID